MPRHRGPKRRLIDVALAAAFATLAVVAVVEVGVYGPALVMDGSPVLAAALFAAALTSVIGLVVTAMRLLTAIAAAQG